eukprot:1160203-Pelagomonas_calceolata.AAC.7
MAALQRTWRALPDKRAKRRKLKLFIESGRCMLHAEVTLRQKVGAHLLPIEAGIRHVLCTEAAMPSVWGFDCTAIDICVCACVHVCVMVVKVVIWQGVGRLSKWYLAGVCGNGASGEMEQVAAKLSIRETSRTAGVVELWEGCSATAIW